MRGLAEFIRDRGWTVQAPTLTHHESRRLDDLRHSNLELWKSDAEHAYQRLSSYRKVVVAGISNGSSLAAHLAIEHDPAGLVMICPPIIPGFSFFKLLPMERIFRWLSTRVRYLPRFDYHMVRDWTLAKDLPRFRKLPAHFTYEGIKLGRYVRENLSKITCPILVVQAKYDNRVDPAGAWKILEAVNSKDKALFYAENSGHVVLLDIDRVAVHEAVGEFLDQV
jgi:carboxylesterase